MRCCDFDVDGVYRAEKHTGANMVVMVEGILNRPMGISVFSHRRQKCKCGTSINDITL